MATRHGKRQPGRKGDEVEHAPAGEAERGAERAEGHTPLTVADAADRAHDGEMEDPPEPSADALSPEEKIAEVAEEHRERLASGEARGRGRI